MNPLNVHQWSHIHLLKCTLKDLRLTGAQYTPKHIRLHKHNKKKLLGFDCEAILPKIKLRDLIKHGKEVNNQALTTFLLLLHTKPTHKNKRTRILLSEASL